MTVSADPMRDWRAGRRRLRSTDESGHGVAGHLGCVLLVASFVCSGIFDWPGIAIARRIIGQGAQPWRLGCADYREAVERLPVGRRLTLTGRAETTPWDSGLSPAMMADNVAVHEEAIVDLLLADLIA